MNGRMDQLDVLLEQYKKMTKMLTKGRNMMQLSVNLAENMQSQNELAVCLVQTGMQVAQQQWMAAEDNAMDCFLEANIILQATDEMPAESVVLNIQSKLTLLRIEIESAVHLAMYLGQQANVPSKANLTNNANMALCLGVNSATAHMALPDTITPIFDDAFVFESDNYGDSYSDDIEDNPSSPSMSDGAERATIQLKNI